MLCLGGGDGQGKLGTKKKKNKKKNKEPQYLYLYKDAIEQARDVCKYLDAGMIDEAKAHTKFYWMAIGKIKLEVDGE